jgi:hypothetical protein
MNNNYYNAVDTFEQLVKYVENDFSKQEIEDMKFYVYYLKLNPLYVPEQEVT